MRPGAKPNRNDQVSLVEHLRYAAVASVGCMEREVARRPVKEEESVNGIMKLLNATTRHCNGIERDRLPDLVSQALRDRGRSHRF